MQKSDAVRAPAHTCQHHKAPTPWQRTTATRPESAGLEGSSQLRRHRAAQGRNMDYGVSPVPGRG